MSRDPHAHRFQVLVPFVCLALVPPLMADAGTTAAEVPLAEIFINVVLVVVPLLLGLGLGGGCAQRRASYRASSGTRASRGHS